MSTRIHRRTVLRGLLGGAAVALGLPTFELFLDRHGEALASGDAFPKRFGVWFWGNGIGPNPANWIPKGTGADWSLSPIMAPLAPVKEEITVVSGLKVYTPNVEPHGVGPCGVLTGGRAKDGVWASRTLDQVIAQHVGGSTPFGSLEFGVRASAFGTVAMGRCSRT